MTESWDWRQTYAQYADTPQPQNTQEAPPQGPEGQGAVPQPYASPEGYEPPPGYGPPAQGYGPSGQGYGPPGYPPYAGPYPQYGAYPPPVAQNRGRGFSIAAFICGGVALLFLPIILGPLGIIFGFVGSAKGDKIGKWAGILSIGTTVVGMALSYYVMRKMGGI